MNSKFIKDTLIFAIGEILPKILSFILLPVFTKYLLPSDYGIIGYVNAVMSFLPVLVTFSLASFLIRFYFEMNSEFEKRNLFGNVFGVVSVSNIIFFIFGLVFFPSIIDFFELDIPWDPYFKLAFITFFLEVFAIIPVVRFRVKEQAFYFVLINFSKVFFQYILILILIVFYDYGLLGYYYGSLIPLIPFVFIYLFLTYKYINFNFNFNQIKTGLNYTFPLVISVVTFMLLNYSDRFILERYISLSSLGLYNLAYTIAFSLSIVTMSGYKAIEPEIFKRYNKSGFENFIYKSKSIYFFALYFFALCISIFSKELITILAPETYIDAYKYIPILMISVLMTGQNVIYGGILTAEKKTKIIGKGTVVGTIVNIFLNLLFIPKFGVIGAAITSAFSFLLVNIYYFKNVNLNNKSMKMELSSLSLYIVSVSFIYIFFKLEISFFSILIKFCIILTYSYILTKIFKINLSILNSQLSKILLKFKNK